MNHRNRNNSFKRVSPKKRSIKQHILFVEGRNTEKSYFDLLKRANCRIIPVTRRGHGIASCVDFVKESYNAWNSMPRCEREKYEKRWLVFDADGRDDFEESVKLARNKKFGVAFSNMCIEYWFMLHFYTHDGSPINKYGDSHSAAQIKMINEFIRKYNKKNDTEIPEYDSGSKSVCDDLFDIMLAIDPVAGKRRIVKAFEQAKNIHESKRDDGAEFQESVTTIYLLLEELGVIEKSDEEEYTLFKR